MASDKASWRGHFQSSRNTWPHYLSRLLDECDVIFHTERPVDVNVVLVQLQQEHDQDEERVTHQEDEHRLVAQLRQLLRDPFLKHEINHQIVSCPVTSTSGIATIVRVISNAVTFNTRDDP